MLAALLIVALQLIVIYTVKKHNKTLIFNQKFNWILAGSLGLTIIQIVLGTTVREHVDIVSETGAPEIMASKSYYSILYPSLFSIIVLLTNLYLFYLNRKLTLGFNKINWVIAILFIEIISGISMYYFAFPFGTQTIHGVSHTLFVQFYTILESNNKKLIFLKYFYN
jgi:cytochrome c oxidase assembly protein subunit 15